MIKVSVSLSLKYEGKLSAHLLKESDSWVGVSIQVHIADLGRYHSLCHILCHTYSDIETDTQLQNIHLDNPKKFFVILHLQE